jgi:hypothetical protein
MAKQPQQPSAEDLRKQAIKQSPEYRKLQRLRNRVEKKFYWSRHDPARSDEARKARTLRYEKLWNRIREKQSDMLGENWTYKHDRRDNWTLEKRDGKPGYYYVHASGQYPDPKTTIVWRDDTGYGKRREYEIRKQVAGDSGYVAGHIVPASAGADPEGVNAGKATRDINGVKPQDRINYTRQNPRINNQRGHKDSEIGIASMRSAGQPLDVSYRVKIKSEGDYPRELGRDFVLRDPKNGNKLNVKLGGNKEMIPEKTIVMNPKVEKGGPHTTNPQKSPPTAAAKAKAKAPATGDRAQATADGAKPPSSFFSKDRTGAKTGSVAKTPASKTQIRTTARAQTPKLPSRSPGGFRFRIR